jgi:hypothetical protein
VVAHFRKQPKELMMLRVSSLIIAMAMTLMACTHNNSQSLAQAPLNQTIPLQSVQTIVAQGENIKFEASNQTVQKTVEIASESSIRILSDSALTEEEMDEDSVLGYNLQAILPTSVKKTGMLRWKDGVYSLVVPKPWIGGKEVTYKLMFNSSSPKEKTMLEFINQKVTVNGVDSLLGLTVTTIEKRFMFPNTLAYFTTGRISGKVLDKDNKPALGAIVSVKDAGGVVSVDGVDKEGQFRIARLKKGAYTLSILDSSNKVIFTSKETYNVKRARSVNVEAKIVTWTAPAYAN